jgi:predicted ATP-dependent endonuclease of OLD family
MKIRSIQIKRYRSIINLKLNLDSLEHLTTICGANNAGKTNVLRAINLFFNPKDYEASKDCPNHKFHGSRGGNVFPEITIDFEKENVIYKITKTFNLDGISEVKGKKIISRSDKKDLDQAFITTFESKISFFFLPSINISFPELINNLIEEIYDLEYAKARFSGLKSELKKSFDNYTQGLVEVLNSLATDINPIFKEFNENWEVGFEFLSDVKKFRDLISTDVEFYFNDKSNRNIEAKGSGLQRLGFILMHSRILSKIKNKQPIILIDEPDIYLHQGLQKKLKLHLENLCPKSQIILTSHSPIFIDSYNLRNTFLLDLEIGKKTFYQRSQKEFYPLNTCLVDIEQSTGNQKIREYLGIELDEFELLSDYNIMVEGDADKKFIEETSKFFSIDTANIIPTHGVSKYEKYLEFYNSFYKDKPNKPRMRLIFDNDNAGRDEYKKIFKKNSQNKYQNLEVTCEFIPNCFGDIPTHEDILKDFVKSNYEVEDFIYPEILVELSNNILDKRDFNKVLWKDVNNRLKANSHKNKGILYNFDSIKNDKNLDNGHQIDFTSEQVKKGIAISYELQGNKKLSRKIREYDIKYPEVKKYLIEIGK